MNEPKTVFDERYQLRAEIGRLRAENANLRGALKYQDNNVDTLAEACEIAQNLLAEEHAQNMRLCAEIAELRTKYETQAYRAMVFADTAWEAKYEAMRKVADAAVADAIVNSAHRQLGAMPVIDQSARLIFAGVSFSTADALSSAVAEYRKLQEGGSGQS